ncbi:MAG: hypothetical protein HY303_02115 [Candidatus Wallbacteria bacterium]|nr:hypothetical protein [Candidatus Wallbacteria bacterium]
MDSIAYLDTSHAGAIVCCGSHGGTSAAQFAARFPVGAVVFNDAGFGKEAAGIRGLDLLAAKGVPAAAVDNTSARIGEGIDVWENGRFSAVNQPAEMLGWRVGQSVREAISQLGQVAGGPRYGVPLAPGRDRSDDTDPENFKAKREISQRLRTSIWKEEPRPGNQFYPERSLCHGYDFYGELLGERPFAHVAYLLLRSELPGPREAAALDLLMTAVINPGPRHWASRAAMNGAVGGTSIGNCVLAGLGTLQGEYHGAQCVADATAMLRWAVGPGNVEPSGAGAALTLRYPGLPGFGLLYSERDGRAERLVELLKSKDLVGPATKLALAAEEDIARERLIWLTLPGVFAAGCVDLGLTEDQAAGLFLISSAPGILAHAAEQRNRRWNEYPIYWDPKLYCYEGASPPGTEEDDE